MHERRLEGDSVARERTYIWGGRGRVSSRYGSEISRGGVAGRLQRSRSPIRVRGFRRFPPIGAALLCARRGQESLRGRPAIFVSFARWLAPTILLSLTQSLLLCPWAARGAAGDSTGGGVRPVSPPASPHPGPTGNEATASPRCVSAVVILLHGATPSRCPRPILTSPFQPSPPRSFRRPLLFRPLQPSAQTPTPGSHG